MPGRRDVRAPCVQEQRAAADRRHMGNITPRVHVDTMQLLRLINVALASMSVEDQVDVVRERMSLTESLTRLTSARLDYMYVLDGPTSALAGFIARCQATPDCWEWCLLICSESGIDARRFANDTAAVLPAEVKGWYTTPVPVFGPERDCYKVVPVGDLPYFHSPSPQCAADPAFRALVAQREAPTRRALSRLVRSVRPQSSLDGRNHEQQVGRLLNDERDVRALDACPKHQPVRWEHVVDAAKVLHARVHPWTEQRVEEEARKYSGLTAQERIVLFSLFSDPIRWDGKTPRLNGGQHRLCGIRGSEVEEVLVGYGRW